MEWQECRQKHMWRTCSVEGSKVRTVHVSVKYVFIAFFTQVQASEYLFLVGADALMERLSQHVYEVGALQG